MPSPAAMTGPPNGAPTSASPAVEDEGAVDDEAVDAAVDAAAGLVGAVDVFVFHRAAADRFALIGGVGRGRHGRRPPHLLICLPVLTWSWTLHPHIGTGPPPAAGQDG